MLLFQQDEPLRWLLNRFVLMELGFLEGAKGPMPISSGSIIRFHTPDSSGI